MPQPPPPPYPGAGEGKGVKNYGGKFKDRIIGLRQRSNLHNLCVTTHCSIYCYFVLLTIISVFVILVLDSVSILSVNAAVLEDQSPYKTYLARQKYEPENAEGFGKDKWARANVRFLTRFKSSPGYYYNNVGGGGPTVDIAASDFHIVELEADKNTENDSDIPEPLRIHLTRKSSVVDPNLRVVVKDGDHVQDWNGPTNATGNEVNCHYVGHVTGAPSTSRGHKGATGLAIFSACPPSNGFSGLVIMEDGRQWYLEPSMNQQRNRQRRAVYSSEDQETLEHVLVPHSHLAGHLAAHISDVLRVPLPQLEEAARLAAMDAAARRNVRQVDSNPSSRDWDDDYEALESLQGESSILTPFFYSGLTPFLARSPDRKGTARKMTSTSKKPGSDKPSVQTTLLTPLESGTPRRSVSSSTSTSTTTRSTSSSSSSSTTTKETSSSSSVSSASIENLSGLARPLPRVVEIAVFTDEELFTKMKSKFNVDTTAQLKEYATAMVNMMDVMYQHSSLGMDLRFRLVYLEVMKRRPNSLKTNGGKAKAYLSSFCDYAGEKNVNSAQWDHALLLTGVDLHEEGVKTTAGLAWAGTMCFRYYSCSISEGLNFASAYITTHEIGHSLGMEHDGVGISEACDANKFIMSPTTGPGKVTWSSCSSSNLQDFIKYGTSELRGKTGKGNFMISRPICLEELVSTRGKKSFELGESKSGSGGSRSGLVAEGILEAESDLKLPGEKYDANFQCSLGMGSFFKPHFERHKPPFDNICWILYCGNGTHAISTHPALEGTPCDRKKYCRAGQCVKRPDNVVL